MQQSTVINYYGMNRLFPCHKIIIFFHKGSPTVIYNIPIRNTYGLLDKPAGSIASPIWLQEKCKRITSLYKFFEEYKTNVIAITNIEKTDTKGQNLCWKLHNFDNQPICKCSTYILQYNIRTDHASTTC